MKPLTFFLFVLMAWIIGGVFVVGLMATIKTGGGEIVLGIFASLALFGLAITFAYTELDR